MLVGARRFIPARASLAASILIALAASSANAESASDPDEASSEPLAARPIRKPINLEIEAPSTDFTKNIAKALNDIYDKYLSFKKELGTDYNVQYSMPVSILPQWGAPNGGPGVLSLTYTPNITWAPFTNTAFGSGLFTFQMQQTQFWSSTSTQSQQAKLGLIIPPNIQPTNFREYNQAMYTQTFPGSWNWLSVTVGQYAFSAYDSNQYAGNAQTNFISNPLAGNATQTYPNGGRGAYAQAATPDQQFTFAAGFQNASNVSATTLRRSAPSARRYAYFIAGEWAPKLLGGGSYELLAYSQPSVPQVPGGSQGVSFNAVQNIDPKWGLFLRANGASVGRNKLDQVGLGVFWDKTNLKAVSQPARSAEWGSELYYNYVLFKGLWLTPDVQLYFDPALPPGAGPAAVFTIRTTAFF